MIDGCRLPFGGMYGRQPRDGQRSKEPSVEREQPNFAFRG